MKKFLLLYGVAGVVALQVFPASAYQVTDNLELGGAIRTRIDYDPDRDIEKFNFDTLRLTAKYTSDTWIGAAGYRFYGKAEPYQYVKFGGISYPEQAWIGYKFEEGRQVHVGLNQVPFGLQPLFGSSFNESLGYPLGMEDQYQVGIKYIHPVGDWNFQGGYYARPAWQGKGTSRDGVTYSAVPSKADDYVVDGSSNQQRNTFVVRAARTVQLGDWASEIGISGMTGSLENTDTHDTGRRNDAALHFSGKNGRWGLQLQAARQQISPRNPGKDDFISLGAGDTSYNIVSRSNLYVADLSYDVPGKYLDDWINGIKVYGNYSRVDKSGNGYKDTDRFILGTVFNIGTHVQVYSEWLFGRNDPYVGGSSYTQSLAAGGTNHWENQVYTNIAYYF